MGNGLEVGVPGADATGEPIDIPTSPIDSWERCPKSGGTGLLDDIRLGGRSALM